MLIAIDKFGNEIDAKDAKRNEKYYCPVCNSEVQLKRGDIKKEHFSHISIHMCERHLYNRESELHLKLKHDLYFKFGQIFNVKMEYYLERIQQIPDLLIDDNHAVEIQLSKVSPTIILNRTKGYKKEGIDVTWLLKEEDLILRGNLLYLTQFHYAVMKDFVLYTVNDQLTVKRYVLLKNIEQNKWLFKNETIRYEEIFKHYCPLFSIETRSNDDLLSEIQKERNKRSYLNPTISLLYQLSLSTNHLPKFLYYITPSERYINNNPLEWKLFLYHAAINKNYDFNQFVKSLSIRKVNGMSEYDIANRLLKEFKEIFRIANKISCIKV
ncbi:hypothetical protein HMPREF2767_06475 [Nosocomiicoccus sp. HMSC067E10]|uniref:competence protein CoiA n=1 Tax=Nosocomiicoccus sp. HMSC067E10 TaxID=1739271 RepID=UPI0008A3ACC7|nr:competence protein CoiA family protein [Nosocomiicoccus sp. HMSC067E10]OFL49188.1 hypothetical protein HMPREF2767_06475 [Nosocomiicoccus sp. HMSC067E10]